MEKVSFEPGMKKMRVIEYVSQMRTFLPYPRYLNYVCLFVSDKVIEKTFVVSTWQYVSHSMISRINAINHSLHGRY